MLLELKVHQFAIINQLQVSFQGGLNILSGETGAGKSVVLKSLSLLMGEKAESDIVRSHCDQASIEGLFDLASRPDLKGRLEEQGIIIDDESLVVRRIINTQGKSKVFLNGQLAPLATLREIVAPMIMVTGVPLIEMTGQHDNRHLQSRQYHLDLLDQFSNTLAQRQQFQNQYTRRESMNGEIAKLREEARTRAQRLDFLVFQRDEIQAAGIKSGEEDAIASQALRLRHGSKLSEFAQEAQHILYGSEDAVTVKLHHLLLRAQELKSADPTLADRLAPLSQAKLIIEDLIYDLREYGKSVLADPEELNRAEERLSVLRKLQKKFGASTEEILSQYSEIEAEISRLENSDSQLAQLEKELKQLELELRHEAEALHKKRLVGAEKLVTKVNLELVDLNMKGVTFGIQVQKTEIINSMGLSEIEFTIQSSKKDEPRPLAKFASGGELSRILLALKRSVGQHDLPRTYLFDEVDTGVSGETAEKVGKKLHLIAKGQQVICVTHLPQVAAFADVHYVIEKVTSKGGAEMRVRPLSQSDRVREIARLISGEKITASSLEHAKQLLK